MRSKAIGSLEVQPSAALVGSLGGCDHADAQQPAMLWTLDHIKTENILGSRALLMTGRSQESGSKQGGQTAGPLTTAPLGLPP